MIDNKENCPHCNSDLQGELIPVEHQEAYGATHFNRKIGLSDRMKDRLVSYICPDCQGVWKVD